MGDEVVPVGVGSGGGVHEAFMSVVALLAPRFAIQMPKYSGGKFSRPSPTRNYGTNTRTRWLEAERRTSQLAKPLAAIRDTPHWRLITPCNSVTVYPYACMICLLVS